MLPLSPTMVSASRAWASVLLELAALRPICRP
jgi:hypothetical protein